MKTPYDQTAIKRDNPSSQRFCHIYLSPCLSFTSSYVRVAAPAISYSRNRKPKSELPVRRAQLFFRAATKKKLDTYRSQKSFSMMPPPPPMNGIKKRVCGLLFHSFTSRTAFLKLAETFVISRARAKTATRQKLSTERHRKWRT